MNERPLFYIGLNIFVLRDGRLLLGKRKGFGEGTWGLPGGNMEFGETMLEGASRELAEETGLIADFKFINLTNGREQVEVNQYIHIGFLAENVQGEPQLLEPDHVYEWQWFEIDHLPENIFTPHQKQIKAFFDKQVFAD